MNDEAVYYVDIPDGVDGEWQGIDQFDTWDEAVEFVKTHFCGDDEGRVCLITEGVACDEPV